MYRLQPKRDDVPTGGAGTVPLRALWAVCIAVLLFAGIIAGGNAYLSRWQVDYLHHIAPTGDDEAVKGVSMTAHALRSDDILVMFGSSELNFQDEFHWARLLAGKPTGFSTYVVGSGYRQSIHNFLVLSALDRELKGRRIVLFISPSWFTSTISDKAYRKNFSLLQAYEFAFDNHMSAELRRRGSRRLLELGAPATEDPILYSALKAMASDTVLGYARYDLVWPVGRTTLAFLRAKDQLDLVRYVNRKKFQRKGKLAGQSQLPPWDELLTTASAKAKASTTSNEWGISDDYYRKYVGPRLAELKDSAVKESWLTSTEYGDFALVLSELKESKARPLIVSLPVMGPYYDYKGHAVADRQAYYDKVHHMVHDAGFPMLDFGDQEYEPAFLRDPWHPGWRGSVYIAQGLDQFYHGTLSAAGH